MSIAYPANTTYSTNLIRFNVTLSETGSCEYSLNSGATNISMNTFDNITFSNSSTLSGGAYTIRFYCNDSAGNRNDTELVLFSISNVEIVKSMTGLVSWWRFEGDAKDSVGSNDGTIYGAIFTSSGKYGGAYQFKNTTADYITTPLNINDSKSWSYIFWINTYDMTGVKQVIDGGNHNPRIFFYQGIFNIDYKNYSGVYKGPIDYTPTTNVWHHFAITWNESTLILYEDGINVNSSIINDGMLYSVATVRLGSIFGGASFNGTLDEVMIFNKSLSASEVADLYNIDLSS